MPATILKWLPKGDFLDRSMGFDAVLTEQHEKTGSATRHAVERGADITDNVILDPERVTLDVLITNQPITDKDMFGNQIGQFGYSQELKWEPYSPPFTPTPGAVFSAIGGAIHNLLEGKKEYRAHILKFISDSNWVSIAQDTFYELIDKRQLVDIHTPVRVYTNMLPVSVSMSRRPDLGDAAQFTLVFEYIRIVESRSAVLPKEKPPSKKVDKGQKSPKEVPEKTSILYHAADKLGALGDL